MIADVTGKRVLVPAGSEFGAKGAALLAAVGIGRFASIAEAVRSTDRSGQSYLPQPQLHHRYAAVYETYGELRGALAPVWRVHADRQKLPG
jgi:sugar (pentulose or hexulose) kinase